MSVRHSHDLICTLCDAKLKHAHPYLALWFALIKRRFPLAHVSHAWRDEKTQNLLFSEGKSRVKWPNSKHNYMLNGKPYSRAIDLFELRLDGFGSWRKDFFREIAEFLYDNDVAIVWGGEWENFPDYPHFELSKDLHD